MSAPHAPVMCDEVLAALRPARDEIIVDGTFGAGGYSRAILSEAECRVIAFDRDASVRPYAEALNKEYGDRFVWLLGNFADMERLLAEIGVTGIHGIVLDLGVSSMQLDRAERGFSFRHDGPLDMRMGEDVPTAADWLNVAPEAEIADVLYLYGDERASRRIARAIVTARADAPLERTAQLAAIVRSVMPRARAGEIDPATRTFQAIRIHINGELAALERALDAAEHLLFPGGRLVVVAFHSLEDRIVKRFLQDASGKRARASRHAPEIDDGALPVFSLVYGGAVKVSDGEARANPRARSARLRAAVRTQAPTRSHALVSPHQHASLGGSHAI